MFIENQSSVSEGMEVGGCSCKSEACSCFPPTWDKECFFLDESISSHKGPPSRVWGHSPADTPRPRWGGTRFGHRASTGLAGPTAFAARSTAFCHDTGSFLTLAFGSRLLNSIETSCTPYAHHASNVG